MDHLPQGQHIQTLLSLQAPPIEVVALHVGEAGEISMARVVGEAGQCILTTGIDITMHEIVYLIDPTAREVARGTPYGETETHVMSGIETLTGENVTTEDLCPGNTTLILDRQVRKLDRALLIHIGGAPRSIQDIFPVHLRVRHRIRRITHLQTGMDSLWIPILDALQLRLRRSVTKIADESPDGTICYSQVVQKLPGNVMPHEHRRPLLQYPHLAPMSGEIHFLTQSQLSPHSLRSPHRLHH